MAIELTTEAIEDSSSLLSFTWKDYDGTGIAATDITTATMTLINRDTAAVINSRSAVDVSSYFNESGEFSMTLAAADNPIVGTPDIGYEWHIATFVLAATVSTLTIERKVEFHIKVRDEKYVA